MNRSDTTAAAASHHAALIAVEHQKYYLVHANGAKTFFRKLYRISVVNKTARCESNRHKHELFDAANLTFRLNSAEDVE